MANMRPVSNTGSDRVFDLIQHHVDLLRDSTQCPRALAGTAMSAAVLGGVLGVLLEAQLLALGGQMEGAPP
jgi:hypothetical protein